MEAELLVPPSGDCPSVPVTVKDLSPTVSGELTVSVEVAPVKVGVTDNEEKEPLIVLIERLTDGMIPVEPETRVSVTMYEPLPP